MNGLRERMIINDLPKHSDKPKIEHALRWLKVVHIRGSTRAIVPLHKANIF